MRTSITIAYFILLLAGCSTPPIIGPLAHNGDPLAGELKLENNLTYRIRPDALTYTGMADYLLPDGTKYRGEFLNGKRQGAGRESLPSGETYEGNWINDQREGQGVLIKSDDSVYTGAFQNNLRAGYGIQTSPAGRYEGDWYADSPHGFGYFTGGQGIEYLGAWEEGKRSGYGVAVMRSQNRYEGMWIDNKRNGYGEEVRLDGRRYTGDWVENKRDGQGTEILPDDSSHAGEWKFNAPLGAGTSIDESGIKLSGMWSGKTIRAGLVILPSQASYAGLLYNPRKRSLNPRFLNWISSQAQRGDAHAALMLAKAYSDYSMPKQSPDKAWFWFVKAANQALVEGQYRLALIYLENSEDKHLAVLLLTEAVKHKHASSALKLAELYERGEGVVQNTATALNLYEQASDGGNMQARNKLAWLLATSSNEQLRDGSKAVALARPMVYLFDTWPYLETLAAALAETQNYSNAVLVQQKALTRAESVTDSGIQEQLTHRLELYQAQKPFRSD